MDVLFKMVAVLTFSLIFMVGGIVYLVRQKRSLRWDAEKLKREVTKIVDSIPRRRTAEGECSICLEAFAGGEVKQMKCQHSYHTECLLTWALHRALRGYESVPCPLCRQDHTIQSTNPEIIGGVSFMDL